MMWVALVLIFFACAAALVFTAWFEGAHDEEFVEALQDLAAADAEVERLEEANRVLRLKAHGYALQLAVAIGHPSQRRLTVAGSDGAKVYTFPVPEAIAHLDWEA